MKLRILLFLLIGSQYTLFSQKVSDSLSVKSLNRASMIGVGNASLADTYLSPFQYKGYGFSLFFEQMNKVSLWNKPMLLQQKFIIQSAFTQNPPMLISEYYGNLNYAISGLYSLWSIQNFCLLGGGGSNASLGSLYNARRSNNPSSLKVQVSVHLSAQALYRWRAVVFRWQVTTPVLGAFFAPKYGQSYYEIFSLGNKSRIIQFASLHNKLALQNYFTIDFPIKNITVRTGYFGDYYKTYANHLLTNITTHQFLFGFAIESINFGGRKIAETTWLKSSYY